MRFSDTSRWSLETAAKGSSERSRRPTSASPENQKTLISSAFRGVSDGTRTHDRLDHNQELYQLSYAHRGTLNLAVERRPGRTCTGSRLTPSRVPTYAGSSLTPTRAPSRIQVRPSGSESTMRRSS